MVFPCLLRLFILANSDSVTCPQLLRRSTDLSTTLASLPSAAAFSMLQYCRYDEQIQHYLFRVIPSVYKAFPFRSLS